MQLGHALPDDSSPDSSGDSSEQSATAPDVAPSTSSPPKTPEEDTAREPLIRQPDDPDAPARGVDETDEPIPEPNEPG